MIKLCSETIWSSAWLLIYQRTSMRQPPRLWSTLRCALRHVCDSSELEHGTLDCTLSRFVELQSLVEAFPLKVLVLALTVGLWCRTYSQNAYVATTKWWYVWSECVFIKGIFCIICKRCAWFPYFYQTFRYMLTLYYSKTLNIGQIAWTAP